MADMNKKNLNNEDELRKVKTDNVAEKVLNLSDDELDMVSGGGKFDRRGRIGCSGNDKVSR